MEKYDKPTEYKGMPQSYTVQAGDTLSAIAKKFYGDESKSETIYQANKALIGNDPNLIQVGQELKIPPK